VRTDASATTYYGFWSHLNDNGSISIQYGDGTGSAPEDRRTKWSDPGVVRSGTWVHVALVVRGPTDMSIFVDGVDVGGTYSGSGGAMVQSADPVQFGKNTGGHYAGLMDDVRIYDRALTPSEVYELAGGVDSGLVAHWKLDESSPDTIAKDSSGNGFDGTLTNGPVWNPTGGKIDGALQLDGANDLVDCGDILNAVKLPLTAACWVKWLGSDHVVFASDDGADVYQGFWLQIAPDGRIAANYGSGGGKDDPSRRTKWSSAVVPSGTWTHIAGVIRGPTDMSVYINGTDAAGSYEGSGGAMVHTSDPAVIGRFIPNGPCFYEGEIDDLRVYARGLGAAEIQQLHEMGQ
jgi:hypothetical protein